MAQMNISVPDGLKGWADKRVSEGRYSSTSDYVRDLIRRDQEGAEYAVWVQARIDEGLASETLDEDAFEVVDRIVGRNTGRRATA